MARIALFNLPSHGHVNPTLAFTRELVARGHDVAYFIPESFRETVVHTGARFEPYGSLVERPPPPGPRVMLPLRLADEALHVYPQLEPRVRAFSPEVIVYDHFCLFALFLARKLGVPAVKLYTTYAAHEALHLFKDKFEQLAPPESPGAQGFARSMAELVRRYEVEPLGVADTLGAPEQDNIVFMPRAFQPGGETFDRRFHFVGPSIAARAGHAKFDWASLQGGPLMYIALGTEFNNWPGFYKMCFEAFREFPGDVLMSIGHQVDRGSLGPAPHNFQVHAHVPQLEALERARAFCTHGGMNSMQEALYYEVPVLVVPQMFEQAMTARRVVQLGLGVALEREHVTVETLRDALLKLEEDLLLRERVREMSAQAREAGGYREAANIIERVARGQRPQA